MILGEVKDIKKSQLNKLNELALLNCENDEFVSVQLIKGICEISCFLGKEIALKIARNGELQDIIVGAKHKLEFETEPATDKLAGVRLIHTHPNGNATLSNLDISALINSRLDAMCSVGIDNSGFVTGIEVAILQEDKHIVKKFSNVSELNNSSILSDIVENEKKLSLSNKKIFVNSDNNSRAIGVLVNVGGTSNIKEDLAELKELAKTNGVEVVGTIFQNREKPDGAYLIGSGKLEEISNALQLNHASLVIFDNELTGSKINNLETALGVKVIDRSMLILDIFAGRAKSSEGKLQVQLAQLKFSLPRLASLAGTSGRFGGGVGMRGPGETQLELSRRVIDKSIVRVSEQLKKLSEQRKLRREKRQTNNQFTVSLVGYTNSGKSTLLNTITKANIYAEDQLFATLDTTTRNVWFNGKSFLLTDTVGFINKLPHEFIDAFASTLEETIYADLLLHIVDVSNKNYVQQMKVVDEVLTKIGANDIPVITVFNKIDKNEGFVPPKNAKNFICISAKENINIEELKEKIAEFIK